jgi:hypothetical protein
MAAWIAVAPTDIDWCSALIVIPFAYIQPHTTSRQSPSAPRFLTAPRFSSSEYHRDANGVN